MGAVALRPPARQHARIATGARIFGACAVGVLAVVQGTNSAAATAGLLAGLAGVCIFLARIIALPAFVLSVCEALLAAVIIGSQLSSLPQGLLYLLVPPFVAGLHAGLAGAGASCLVQTAVVGVVTAPSWSLESLVDRAEFGAPWFFASVGSGAIAVWLRHLDAVSPRDSDGYHAARRLLAELRTVARSLSAGLDAVGIAQQILVEVRDAIDNVADVVLVRTDGGILVPLTQDESGRLSEVGSDDPVVMECWTTEAPAQEAVGGRDDRRIRVALPLQAGVRMVGVVVAECRADPSPDSLQRLRDRLSEHTLRLDTALVFDEVRSLATADERRRLAREIHDGIAQEVASIGYAVDELIAQTPSDEQREGLRTLRNELTRLVSELRLSIFDLRSGVTQSAGFAAALTDYVRQVGARSGMTVHLSLNETPQRLRVEVETEILRLAQEAITNARRHSGASNLWVTFAADPPHATLTITDDGHGLRAPRSDSYGLRIMRERAERIGASLDIRSREQGGTQVSLTLATDTSRRLARPLGTVAAPRKDNNAYVGLAHR